MKVYIATRLERVEEYQVVAARLEGLGHEITYRWDAHALLVRARS